MLAALLADTAMLLHLAFVLFVVFGGLLVLARPWMVWIHIPMVIWSAVVNLMSWLCPLTPLENYFRRQAGESGYEGGFLSHYLAPIIYPRNSDWDLGLVIGVSVLVWNGLIYGIILYRHCKAPKQA